VSTGPSFRFRLERVRALRERYTDAARQDLAQALHSLDDSRTRLDDVEAELARARTVQRRTASPSREPVTAARLCAQQDYAERIDARREVHLAQLSSDRAAVATRTDELAHAARSQQTLERLKERRRAEHRREFERREGIALDEIALQRFRGSAA
jgi:flagellar export protein FliJ